MKKKNNLILIESEMLGPKGHFLNNLIDTTITFRKKFNIIWFLNQNFASRGTYIPSNIKIIKSINTNKFKRKNHKFLYIIEEIFLFFLNLYHIFFYTLYFIKKKKFISFISALRSNFFLLPRYFSSFYKKYKLLNLSKNDHIFFPTARRKDMALINFLTRIEDEHPKFHIRVMLPPKIKFKGFFYYLKKIDKQLREKTAYVYLWSEYNYKLFVKNSLSKKGIFKSNIPWTFYKRNFKYKNHVVGYMGDARPARGFQHLPKLINILEKKNTSLNYLIQFSRISDDLIDTKKQLYNLAKKNKRVKIIEKYSDYKEYKNYLKNIDIMPILHSSKEINEVTSGTMYSCIPYEIPIIYPYGTKFMNNILKNKSFEKAISLNQFANKIVKISKNYKSYLSKAKLNSRILKKILKNDPLINNIS